MRKFLWLIVGTFYLSPVLMAGPQVKTETVEEQEKTEVKIFCSKSSEKDALATCQKWLESQSRTLGQRLLTSYCSEGELQTNNSGCLYRSTGELKYVLKKLKTETERSN